MSTRLRSVLRLSAGLACLPGFAQAQADILKHDPFARPAPAARRASAAPMPATAVKPPLPEPVWKPELRAIMVAGSKSIVNVDGALVRIGEQFNGYRLVEVHEETAVFVNDTKRVTLSLGGIKPLRTPPPRQDDRGVAQQRDDSRKPEGK
jgi:hypothetical protein